MRGFWLSNVFHYFSTMHPKLNKLFSRSGYGEASPRWLPNVTPGKYLDLIENYIPSPVITGCHYNQQVVPKAIGGSRGACPAHAP